MTSLICIWSTYLLPDEVPTVAPVIPIVTPTPELTPTPTSVTPKRQTKVRKVKCKLTAYCPCRQCSGGYGRHTATGVRAKSGRTVAVDPRVIKYGTKIKIGTHTYRAEDCGGGVKGNHIDIFFDTHSEVDKFGRKYRKVVIMKK